MTIHSSTTYFLHGLDSSGRGTKGRFLTEHFPQLVAPDFTGTLKSRLLQLQNLCKEQQPLIFVGSSFGGLMATCYAIREPLKITRLILLAPALNFVEYSPPDQLLQVPTQLIIGKHDTVTPPDLVLPLAEKTFERLTVHIEDDDHMLHKTFHQLDWERLLAD